MLTRNDQPHGKHYNGRKHQFSSHHASQEWSGYFVMANAMIRDKKMSPAAKRLYAALLAYKGGNDKLCKAMDELCRLSGIDSRTTLCRCLRELEGKALISRIRNYRYSMVLKRVVYDANGYRVAPQDLSQGYTLVPRSLLAADLTNGAFFYALEVYALSGRTGRSWLSLRRTASKLCMALSTVCKALGQFLRTQVVSKLRCRKNNLAYACNSYYPVDFVRVGAPKNGQLLVINKITEEFNSGKRKKVSANSAVLPNFEWLLWPEKPWHWDGKAYRVSAWGEPDDIAI